MPIPGATKPRRLGENAGAATVDLTADDLRGIEETLEQVLVVSGDC